MKENICCFTGHRKINPELFPQIRIAVNKVIHSLIEKGVTEFRCGGARGFDTICAQEVIKLKRRGFPIKLVLMLPCRDQTLNWSNTEKMAYEVIKCAADDIHYTTQFYEEGCMLRRNRALLAGSFYCVCYLTQSSGGTAYTVRLAKNQGLRLINVAEMIDRSAFDA